MSQVSLASPAAPRKGLAIWSLVLGLLSLPTFSCLGVGAIAGIVLGIVALVKIGREPAEYGGKGMAITGIVTSALSFLLIPFIGVVAAIAIPSLLRARISANEAMAIGDIRTFIVGQASYQISSGGAYGTPECLAAPANCIAGYQGPTFLDPSFVSEGEKGGYRRRFHPGPGLEYWAFVAVPAQPNRTGVRAFCGDSTGRVCSTPDGEVDAGAGQCPMSCVDLR